LKHYFGTTNPLNPVLDLDLMAMNYLYLLMKLIWVNEGFSGSSPFPETKWLAKK
jgi:hypothetical protein